ncbi:DUF4389 domain-containing protein [Georgenia yuyongxinii]|uniref:DUF4389 domain-containing protein n=1 Tax=Georgenia yuyongxinii TaxID=2589797 RepID=A0A5B8C492_9MICO|nr:DUF4389 domain-containing protein [Georgenia yuyongxinii]QDC25394.1 DUF4389 domain-containing protein [Georgenia yuyongxinii]
MVTAAAAPSPVVPAYPVHVDAQRPATLSRWLWLVKWVLAIPHYLILALLWAAFLVLSVVALVAIVVTGRYPESIFEFNVGVLRWNWRVAYYSYGALATDQYPPFTLAEVDDYPAHLRVDYPDHLSRGLALVKWWLLAIPQYIVVGLLVGGGATIVRSTTDAGWRWEGGLIAILVLVAGVILLVTGSYPRALYDLLLGLNRWVIRVAAYAGLMTDKYPPFRLDMGEHEGVSLYTGPPPAGPSGPSTGAVPAYGGPQPGYGGPPPGYGGPPPGYYGGPPPASLGPAAPPPGAPPPRATWTGGRLVAVVLGSLLALIGLGGLATGATMGFWHLFERDDGFVTSRAQDVASDGYAVVLGEVDLRGDGMPVDWPQRLFGEVRVRATATDGGDVFLGVAPAADTAAYLDGVRHHVGEGNRRLQLHDGGQLTVPPEQMRLWLADAAGPGTQSVRVDLPGGRWVAVVMAPDGSSGIDATVDVGATVPWLPWFALGALVAGLAFAVAGAAIIVVTSRRAISG